MYDKKQIISEIKRIAKSLKTQSLKKKDFLKNTMIPVSTINFYLSSWEEALKEAGLKADSSTGNKIESSELLMDLIEIEKDHGERPTYALIEKYGKYSKEDYLKKWRNLDEAFKLAKLKYGDSGQFTGDKTIVATEFEGLNSPDSTIVASKDKNSGEKRAGVDMEETLVSIKKEDINLTGKAGNDLEESSDVFGKNNILTIDQMTKEEELKPDQAEDEPSFNYNEDDGGIENLDSIGLSKPKKKKIVPVTIKPKKKKSDKQKGESIDFRGIKFAPVDTRGVIFIFGLISEELNFIIESFGADRFCFSGKRNTSSDGEKWEYVNIGFALDSLDLKSGGRMTKNCNFLVCWNHGWEDCPIEVLELRSTLDLLRN